MTTVHDELEHVSQSEIVIEQTVSLRMTKSLLEIEEMVTNDRSVVIPCHSRL